MAFLGKVVPFFFLGILSLNATGSTATATATELGQKIQFSYSSTDGDITLECKHWIENAGAGDFDVICGKGTATVKQYSVHLVVRELPQSTATSFEILYWVTDRNTNKPVPGFSSHSQIFTVENKTKIREFTMSQGLENDGFQLSLRYKP